MARNDNESAERSRVGRVVATIRTYVAHLLWLVCALCALVLAVGALLVALGANDDNAVVDLVLRAADAVDLGVFSREDGVAHFRGQGAEVKDALVNWGWGAVAWLFVGRLMDWLARP